MDPVVVLAKAFELAAHIDGLMRAAVCERGLTPARAEALLVLRDHGRPVVQRELADLLRCTPRHVTALIDVLEQQGWVQRRPHPTDRRATLITLTPRGHDEGTWMTTNRHRAAHALLGDLPAADLAGFVAVSDRLLAKVGHGTSAPG